MNDLLIRNARLVNEGHEFDADLLIHHGRIEKIASCIDAHAVREVDAAGQYLLPGLIDDQVHFRDPGAPHKGSFASESRAAVAGGITSVMDMPNTHPPTLTLAVLEAKERRAASGGERADPRPLRLDTVPGPQLPPRGVHHGGLRPARLACRTARRRLPGPAAALRAGADRCLRPRTELLGRRRPRVHRQLPAFLRTLDRPAGVAERRAVVAGDLPPGRCAAGAIRRPQR